MSDREINILRYSIPHPMPPDHILNRLTYKSIESFFKYYFEKIDFTFLQFDRIEAYLLENGSFHLDLYWIASTERDNEIDESFLEEYFLDDLKDNATARHMFEVIKESFDLKNSVSWKVILEKHKISYQDITKGII